MKHALLLLVSLLVVGSLSACRATAVQPVVGIFSAAGAENPSPLTDEQEKGYGRVFDAGASTLKPTRKTESALQDETQKSIRALAENEAQPVVAIIGATSNEATTRAAALVNFFNVPMVIPTAGGDGLMPSNNLWAFRLSAPGSAYARYFFGDVLNKTNITHLNLLPTTLAKFKIAILYEQNTFGETAAVASAETILAQVIEINAAQSLYGMEIAVYESFPDQSVANDRLNTLALQVKNEGAQLVYVVANNPEVAGALGQAFRQVYAQTDTQLPVMVGQAGAFATRAFAASTEAADIVLLRQVWNRERCPEDITSFYEAQSYGAAYLLDVAVQQVQDIPATSGLKLKQPGRLDLLTAFRENLRNQIKNSQLNVPCFGQVSFDNTGQNRELQFELISLKNGSESPVAPADFLNTLKTRILLDE